MKFKEAMNCLHRFTSFRRSIPNRIFE